MINNSALDDYSFNDRTAQSLPNKRIKTEADVNDISSI